MNADRLGCCASCFLAISLTIFNTGRALAEVTPVPHALEARTPESEAQRKKDERRRFQTQELITAHSGTWIFTPGQTPRIVWRDVEEVQRLGGDARLRVRWFDAKLNEFPAPNQSGRWLAWIEGTAPNGTPLRRSLTFYGLPKDLPSTYAPDLTVTLPRFPGTNAPVVLKEHEAEAIRLANDVLIPAVIGSEKGAIVIAGLAESKPLGRPARFIESAAVLNDDYHLALKLKVQGLRRPVRALQPPRRRDPPATILREGSPAEAGMRPDAKTKIDDVCRAWAGDSGEPFVTLVARQGVVVTHEAFGRDGSGQPITRDYRCWLASITKTVTALLFSQFVDQNLIALDDPLSAVFRGDRPALDPAHEARRSQGFETCRRPAVQSAHGRARLLFRMHLPRRSGATVGDHAGPQTERTAERRVVRPVLSDHRGGRGQRENGAPSCGALAQLNGPADVATMNHKVHTESGVDANRADPRPGDRAKMRGRVTRNKSGTLR